MKGLYRVLIAVTWAILLYALYKLDLLTGNMDSVNKFLSNYSEYKAAGFVVLASLRVAALIPSAVFMILGGMLFHPAQGAALTLISIVLSETAVYAVSKVFISSAIQSRLVNRYPKVYKLLMKNNIKILTVGILCPAAPSDAVCFLAGSTGLTYRKYIAIVAAANLPMLILYSLLGSSVVSSIGNTVVIAVCIVLIGGYSFFLWSREHKQQKLA